MRGKGELILTGQLGDVMKESARAAWTFARSHAAWLGIDETDFERDVHIHVPAGAIPEGRSVGRHRDGHGASSRRCPSRPVRNDVAMTGEITLSGRVLPIGGLKEKILGAVRAGITHDRDPEGQRGRPRGPAARRCATRSRSPGHDARRGAGRHAARHDARERPAAVRHVGGGARRGAPAAVIVNTVADAGGRKGRPYGPGE